MKCSLLLFFVLFPCFAGFLRTRRGRRENDDGDNERMQRQRSAREGNTKGFIKSLKQGEKQASVYWVLKHSVCRSLRTRNTSQETPFSACLVRIEDSSKMMEDEDKKEDIALCASCDRCRSRKTKCDGQRPCSNCTSKYLKKNHLDR